MGAGAQAIAVDTAANVYVTGAICDLASGDEISYFCVESVYATIKYDTSGNRLWVARYLGGYLDNAFAYAIVLDAAGNVYVTGTSLGDSVTIKYDTDGNELWVARYHPGDDGSGYGGAIALDPVGNVYVTGASLGDYATIKYDTDGNQLWVARYDGPGNGDDKATALALDAAGSVYITGWSFGLGTGFDYATIKYDANGNQLWVARYDGPGNGDDSATALALDAAGSVYITGSSVGLGTGFDYATIKYDANGNQLWVARYNGGYASAIVLDPVGNVYVTGTSNGYATVKYSQQ